MSDENPLAPGRGSRIGRRHVLAAGASVGTLSLGSAGIDDGLTHIARSIGGPAVAGLHEIVPRIAVPPAFENWHPGDPHVHSTHSHDVCAVAHCGAPHEFGLSVGQQLLAAELRGLDYVGIADHDTVAAHRDDQYRSRRVTLLDAYEHNLANGHAGMYGVTGRYEYETRDIAGAEALMGAVHADGGVTIVNHPRTDISSKWNYRTPAGADGLEVWSIGWYLQESLTDGVLASNNHRALALYDAYLNAGYQLAAVGGSDNHWRSTTMLQGVGQPTTWIRAPDRERASLLEGLRSGRTVVSWDWLGPLATMELETSTGSRARIGDTVASAGNATLTVRVTNGIGHRVRLVAGGSQFAARRVQGSPFTWVIDLDLAAVEPPSWIRAEVLLEEQYTMRALTSPIYLTADGSPPVPDPAGLPTPPDPPPAAAQCCHAPAVRHAVHELDRRLGPGRPADAMQHATLGSLAAALNQV